jgi:hypothetical protein
MILSISDVEILTKSIQKEWKSPIGDKAKAYKINMTGNQVAPRDDNIVCVSTAVYGLLTCPVGVYFCWTVSLVENDRPPSFQGVSRRLGLCPFSVSLRGFKLIPLQ